MSDDTKREAALAERDDVLVIPEDYRLTIPRSIRESWGIKPGDKIMVEAEGAGFKLTPVKSKGVSRQMSK